MLARKRPSFFTLGTEELAQRRDLARRVTDMQRESHDVTLWGAWCDHVLEWWYTSPLTKWLCGVDSEGWIQARQFDRALSDTRELMRTQIGYENGPAGFRKELLLVQEVSRVLLLNGCASDVCVDPSHEEEGSDVDSGEEEPVLDYSGAGEEPSSAGVGSPNGGEPEEHSSPTPSVAHPVDPAAGKHSTLLVCPTYEEVRDVEGGEYRSYDPTAVIPLLWHPKWAPHHVPAVDMVKIVPMFAARVVLQLEQQLSRLEETESNRKVVSRRLAMLARDHGIRQDMMTHHTELIIEAFFQLRDDEVWAAARKRFPRIRGRKLRRSTTTA